MNKNDYLWKGILENVTDDFLRFFFKDADTLFDLEKGFSFLDKELADLFPDEEGKSPKFVDKLIKVFTRATGDAPSEEKWILVHVEVQGYRDDTFPWRMHTYFYRILDRYRHPVTAVAILTDGDRNYRPGSYEYDFLGTSFIFRFNTYKVLDQEEEALRNDSNPFAAVVLTVLTAIKNKGLPDKELFELKRSLLRNLLRHQIPAPKIDKLIIFLQIYVLFEDREYARQFEKEIEDATKSDKSMGIRELVLEKIKEEGIEKGIEKGYQEKTEKAVHNLVKASILTDEQIASALEVSVDYVARIRMGLESEE